MAVATRATQSLALTVSADYGQVRSTQSLVLAVCYRPGPSAATTCLVLPVCRKAVTGPFATQSLILVLCNDETSPLGQPARCTQSIVLVVSGDNGDDGECEGDDCGGGGGCPDLLGTWKLAFGDLRYRTLRMLGEQATSPKYWRYAQIGRYVNDAYLRICRDTKALEMIESTTTTVGTSEYSLSDNLMQVKRVFLDDWALPNVTKWERDRQYGDWQSGTSKILGYMTSQQNNRTIRFDQLPQSVVDVDVWGVKMPDALVDECDGMELPPWYHPAIAFKAAARAAGVYGEQQDKDLASAYEAIANDYTTLLSALVGHRVGER